MRGSIFNVFALSSVARVLGALLGFATTFASSMLLGPKNAGELYGTVAWALGLAILSRWGVIDRILVEQARLVDGWRSPAFPASINRDLVTCLFRTIFWLVLFIGARRLGSSMGYDLPIDLALLVGLTLAVVVLQIICAAAKAKGLVAQALVFEFVIPPLTMLMVLMLCVLGQIEPGVMVLGGSYLAGTAIGAIGCFYHLLYPTWHWRIQRNKRMAASRRMHDFAMTEISSFATSWFPILLLPVFTSAHDVGIFNLAYRISGSIGLIAATSYSIILPKLSIARANNDKKNWDHIIIRSRLFMICLSVMFILFIVFEGDWIMLRAGEDFSKETHILYIMSIFFSLGLMAGPSSGILIAARFDKISRNVNILSSIFSFFLTIALTYGFGMTGAAIATGVAFLSNRLLLLFFECKIQKSIVWQRYPLSKVTG